MLQEYIQTNLSQKEIEMTKHVLIVDDDYVTAKWFVSAFEESRPDWLVEIVSSNATDGLDRSLSEHWDLLIWDIWMPPGDRVSQPPIEDNDYGVTSGIEAIAQIKKSLGEKCPPILALTVLGDRQVPSTKHIPLKLEELGVTCLTKPIEEDDLIKSCEKALSVP
jgi:CheY-like chemotaxis protein